MKITKTRQYIKPLGLKRKSLLFTVLCLGASMSSVLHAGTCKGTQLSYSSVQKITSSQTTSASFDQKEDGWLRSSSSSTSSGSFKRIECKNGSGGDKWLQSSAGKSNNAAGYGDGAIQVGVNSTSKTGDLTKWKLVDAGVSNYYRIECKKVVNGDKWLQSSAGKSNNAAGYGDGAIQAGVNTSSKNGDLTRWRLISVGSSYYRIECKNGTGGDKWLQSSAGKANNAAGYGDGAVQAGVNSTSKTGDLTKWRFLDL